MVIRSLEGVEVRGKRVLVRCDFNVPMEGGEVRDRSRIEGHVSTLRRLREGGARVMILSHLGRPKGEDELLSLKRIVRDVEEVCGVGVKWLGDVVGEEGAEVGEGEMGLFENVRFHEGETRGDESFSRRLGLRGELFVGDAFSVSHRGHSSVSGVAGYVESVGGELMCREVGALEGVLGEGVLGEGRGSKVAVVGGAKISTKLLVLEGLLERVDVLVLVGAMAHTFLLARGWGVGKSLVEMDLVMDAKRVEARAKELGVRLVLPEDVVVERGGEVRVCGVEEIGEEERALDVGEKTLEVLGEVIGRADRVVWNGPLGLFEDERFLVGTRACVGMLREATRGGCLTVGGGGDTVAALRKCGGEVEGGALSYVSLAGGAFLEYLEGRSLPGVEVLKGERNVRT